MKQFTRLIPLTIHSLSESANEIPDNIIQIGAPNMWEQGHTGDNSVIAVLDTGCNTQHPDLADSIIGGRNFTDDFNGDPDEYGDSNGHGTHAAGVIAAVQNGKGIVGVAPDARLLILKVLNQNGSGTVENLKKALHYAMNWKGPNRETVDVVSLSLGLKNYDQGLHETIRKVVQSGRVVVAAAGNDGDGNAETEEYRYPGGFPEVVQVGSMDDSWRISYFSNTNQEVDLYAPGETINSTFPEGRYARLSGTSMAAPHVSGALALLAADHMKVYGRKPTVLELLASLQKHNRAFPDLDQHALVLKKDSLFSSRGCE